ncbi:MAG: restriction endonuclease subunit S [Thermomicrobiales bacterium]
MTLALPVGWTLAQIGELAQVRGGKRLPAGFELQDTPTPFPYIRVTDMRDGGVDDTGIRFVPVKAAPAIRNYRIGKDDIFISVAGTLGVVGRVPSSLHNANLTENADRLTEIKCNLEFLMYSLLSDPIQREIEAIRTIGAQPKLALGRIKSFEITLPSDKNEQARIASALSDADDLIAALERHIAKRRAIKQGIMQELLTGRTRLPGFDGPVPVVKLGGIASMKSGGTPDTKVSRYYGGDIPWVSISDMTSGGKYIRSTHQTLTEAGLKRSAAKLYAPDVVLYAMYASLGECSMAIGQVTSSQAILGIQADSELDREFLYYCLQSSRDRVRTLGQQGTQSNLNAGMVRNFEIRLPPIGEQTAIVEVLSDADADIEALERRLKTTRDIKQGMMQELLTGRTRLPVEEDAE